MDRDRTRVRLAGTALLASAAINAVGVAALLGMFAGFAIGARSVALTLGRTNDVLSIPGTLLMVPAVYELYLLTGPHRRSLRLAVAVVGLGAMIAITWLQLLLVTERLTFEQEVGPVSLGFLAIATWFVATGWLASRVGVMPRGVRLGVAAASYLGQPLWALRWAQALMRRGAEDASQAPIPDRYAAGGERTAG